MTPNQDTQRSLSDEQVEQVEILKGAIRYLRGRNMDDMADAISCVLAAPADASQPAQEQHVAVPAKYVLGFVIEDGRNVSDDDIDFSKLPDGTYHLHTAPVYSAAQPPQQDSPAQGAAFTERDLSLLALWYESIKLTPALRLNEYDAALYAQVQEMRGVSQMDFVAQQDSAAMPSDAIENTLLRVITDIRIKTGVGVGPMLVDLADAVAAKCKVSALPSAGLLAAASAVVARWDSPHWKHVATTAEYIHALREAIEGCQPTGSAE